MFFIRLKPLLNFNTINGEMLFSDTVFQQGPKVSHFSVSVS